MLIKSVEWPSLAKAGARSLFAGLILLGWIRRPAFTFSKVQILAAVAYAATVSLFVIANDRTTAANSIFLQYTAPIYVALLGHWVLGEKARRMDWVCICIALCGIALFFRDEFDTRGAWGIAAGLGSGVAFADVIVITIFADQAKVLDSIKAGARGYLLKDERIENCAESIRQFHFAIEHRENRASVVRDGDMKLRAANRSGGRARLELNLGWFVAMEKVKQPLAQAERRLVRQVFNRLDEKLREFSHAERALIEQVQRGATAFAGADAVGDAEGLICLGGRPDVRASEGGFHFALGLQHHDLVFTSNRVEMGTCRNDRHDPSEAEPLNESRRQT